MAGIRCDAMDESIPSIKMARVEKANTDTPSSYPDPEACSRLERYLAEYPHLTDRILRQLLVALHERGVVSIDQIYDEARIGQGDEPSSVNPIFQNPNVA